MALVKYGGGIVQMSGSIAGDTHARNRYGNYIRARTKPINPNTERQVEVRAALALLVERWSEVLTANQRAAWNLYASNVSMQNKLGETINLSGFNHYIRSNSILIPWSVPPIDDGPVVFTIPDQDPTLAFTASEAAQSFIVTFDDTLAWNDENGGFMFFEQGVPQNPQRNFFNGPWRRIGAFTGVGGGGPASPNPIAPMMFPIAEGQRQWIYARIRRADGRLSERFTANIIVAA